ncbi:MAG TPA: secretin N-terminal domain-containing protein [Fimbriimonadaceae bacterium]|nr:secretin N-terminal domain-containing protein [Fimbriimonadaceae bacterium]
MILETALFGAWLGARAVIPDIRPSVFGFLPSVAVVRQGDQLAPSPAPQPKEPSEILCSVNATQEDPAKILQILSHQTKANLMLLTPSDVKLTLRLTDVPLGEMIRHIAALTGMAHLKIGNTFVLASEDRLKAAYPLEWERARPQPVPAPSVAHVTQTYRTSFVSSSQIATAIEKLLPGRNLSLLAGPAQVSPNIANQDGSKATGTSTTILERDPSADVASRVLVISGPPDAVAMALELARQLDVARTQITISVTIYDISNDALKELGLSWNFGGFSVTEDRPNGINFGSFDRSPLSFSAAIKALETSNHAKLLAAPSVSLLDGERAFVLIGSRINFPVLVGYSQANSPIFSKEEERVGIYLQVAATVASDGSMTLSLYPQVSTITGFLEVNGASYPQIATREAQTTVRVRPGESIVLGGLFRDEEISHIERVPILSEVPILGELFKRRKKSKSSGQVIITVTPTITTPHSP